MVMHLKCWRYEDMQWSYGYYQFLLRGLSRHQKFRDFTLSVRFNVKLISAMIIAVLDVRLSKLFLFLPSINKKEIKLIIN